MFNTLQIFQLSYTIPLTIFYYYFTILLTYKILIKKDSYFNNGFYPFLLAKSYGDIVSITDSFITIRLPRWNIGSNFFLKHTFLPTIYYIETSITYNTMLSCSFFISLNRYIALKYPISYQRWFSNKMLKYYFITTFITSTAIGFVIAYYQPYYQWNEEIKGYFVDFKNPKIGFFIVIYTLALYLPCALIAILLNILAAYEYKKYRKKQWSIKMKKELNLLFYSVINLIAFLIFFVYFLFRSLHIIFNIPTLQNFAIMTIPWINDIRTFGLFYTSLIICKPLRNLVLLKKTNTVHYNTRKSFTSRTNILFKVSKK